MRSIEATVNWCANVQYCAGVRERAKYEPALTIHLVVGSNQLALSIQLRSVLAAKLLIYQRVSHYLYARST